MEKEDKERKGEKKELWESGGTKKKKFGKDEKLHRRVARRELDNEDGVPIFSKKIDNKVIPIHGCNAKIRMNEQDLIIYHIQTYLS